MDVGCVCAREMCIELPYRMRTFVHRASGDRRDAKKNSISGLKLDIYVFRFRFIFPTAKKGSVQP